MKHLGCCCCCCCRLLYRVKTTRTQTQTHTSTVAEKKGHAIVSHRQRKIVMLLACDCVCVWVSVLFFPIFIFFRWPTCLAWMLKHTTNSQTYRKKSTWFYVFNTMQTNKYIYTRSFPTAKKKKNIEEKRKYFHFFCYIFIRFRCAHKGKGSLIQLLDQFRSDKFRANGSTTIPNPG